MKYHIILSMALALSAANIPAYAQIIPNDSIVYSQTIIGIVPGSTVPKAVTLAPELQGNLDTEGSIKQDAPDTSQDSEVKDEPAETAVAESALSDVKAMLTEQPVMPEIKLQVQVRGEQIPVSRGLFHTYLLDNKHGLLTYFSDAYKRPVIAENISKPLDILFIREDGVVAQIVPEVVLAYLAEDIKVEFPLKALLYIQGGLAQQWGVQPGFRIEHGMFKPKPMVYTTPTDKQE
ncbi:MAG: DUF192 domain-containing protein [Alphaproteobacteria bacterium]|nr:DUF192 domain-containing protein [Alphaproteobacteria bacterium]